MGNSITTDVDTNQTTPPSPVLRDFTIEPGTKTRIIPGGTSGVFVPYSELTVDDKAKIKEATRIAREDLVKRSEARAKQILDKARANGDPFL